MHSESSSIGQTGLRKSDMLTWRATMVESKHEHLLTGTNVYMRAINESDIDKGWLDWINDQSLTKGLILSGSQTREDLLEYIRSSRWPNAALFAICLQKDDRYIGNARLSGFDWVHRYCDYGWLLSGGTHGKGYGSESLFLLMRYGFLALELNRISSAIASFNSASLRCSEKIGMSREGIQRQRVNWDGEFHDAIAVSMLREEFDELYPDGSIDAYWDRQNT